MRRCLDRLRLRASRGLYGCSAVLAYGPADFAFTNTSAKRPLQSGEVRIEVEACGICASDVKMFKGSEDLDSCFYWGTNGRVRNRPVIPGHEFVGTVVESRLHGYTPGDRITAETQVSCGNCWFCTNGHKHKCDSLRIFGQGIDGAMATHLVLPQGSAIHRVPARVPAAHAVLAEPLSVSLRAVTRAKIADEGAGQLLAVSGCGPIGLGLVVGLRALAPRATVVAVDPLPSRREVALACGAHSAVDPAAANVTALLAELAPERGGCDVYFEATGASASIDTGLRALRKCGTMVLVGISSGTTAGSGEHWNTISAQKELYVVGSNLGLGMWPTAIAMLSGEGPGPPLPLDRLVTHVHPLESFLEGFEQAMGASHSPSSIKVVLDPRLRAPSASAAAGATTSAATGRDAIARAGRESKVGRTLAARSGAGSGSRVRSNAARNLGTSTARLGVVIDGGSDGSVGCSEGGTTGVVVGHAGGAGVPAMQLSDGSWMPSIGVGTFHGSGTPPAAVQASVAAALRLGYRHIDTAEKYGVLKAVGNAIASVPGVPRAELYVASKLWNTNHAPEHVRLSVEHQLAQLGIGYLDQLLVHWPLAWRHTGVGFDEAAGGFFPMRVAADGSEEFDAVAVPLSHTWEAMEELVREGLVRSIGVSNVTAVQLNDLLAGCTLPPVTNQVECAWP